MWDIPKKIVVKYTQKQTFHKPEDYITNKLHLPFHYKLNSKIFDPR